MKKIDAGRVHNSSRFSDRLHTSLWKTDIALVIIPVHDNFAIHLLSLESRDTMCKGSLSGSKPYDLPGQLAVAVTPADASKQ